MGMGENGYRVPGTRGKGAVPSCTGAGGLGGSLRGPLSRGYGVFPVVLPPVDAEAAMSRTAG